MPNGKPNILVLWGDDIGWWNISYNSRGQMGYRTPNIDRVANEGVAFTDYYAQQSCTAGRAAFLGGNVPVRTGMTKVGLPGAKEGWQKTDVTMATVLKGQGYATGQFGKNHQGDRDEHLPTMHGFDEFFGNLYHLNAEEEPELRMWRNEPGFNSRYRPRGVLDCVATREDIDEGWRKYEDLNQLAVTLVEPGGLLVTCSCSFHVSEAEFVGMVAEAARDAHRVLRIVEKRGQAVDHPAVAGIPETQYLKCVIGSIW